MKINFPHIFKRKAKADTPIVLDPPIAVPAQEDEIPNKMKKVNIKALEGSRMTPGKVYTVSAESAKVLIDNDRAVAAKDSEKVGKVYSFPAKKADVTD